MRRALSAGIAAGFAGLLSFIFPAAGAVTAIVAGWAADRTAALTCDLAFLFFVREELPAEESALPRVDRLTPDGQLNPLELPEEADGVSIVPGPDGAMYFMQSLNHTLWRAGDTLETINLQVVDRVGDVVRPVHDLGLE